ncbi:hypothetical protein BGZ99_008011 [Dissophora globulifera]|uniref:TM7S3/TM198-like domain-containing protein n=1 Tax=Dissophora globulifera TaxID=979702 RepID=A0A9P6RZA9_9FUNG|nr:hypothetical protein BGZ99_008011 [Dissophora globulifera]
MIIVNVNSGSYQSSGVYFAVWLLVGIVGAIAFVLVAVIFTAAKVQNYAFRYAFLAVCVVAGGYLTKRYERYAVIIATSFGGAYCMMFGLDMFVQDQFRTTFHVILSQSSAAFYPDAGTWVMVAFVPVIAALGIVWELKHHEEPVGSWWFGHGARPLPPLPGEKPARKCCGITMARSAKDAEKSAGDSTAALTGGSDATLVQSPTTVSSTWHWASGLNTCCGKRGKTAAKLGAQDSSTTAAIPGTDDLSSTGAVDAMTPTSMETVFENDKAAPSDATKIGSGSKSHPLPVEKENYGEGHETIGHTGVHKVVIQREVREFSLDVDERL